MKKISTDKTQIVRARVTDPEWGGFHALMAAEGLNHSELLRQIVRDAVKKAGLWPVKNGGAE
jgi:hypothetical protein